MGSYSHKSGILPFMGKNDYEHATAILQRVIDALSREGRKYIGSIYGQFMLTNAEPKVVEINARWGDPEAMNVLPLLRTNFVDICLSMLDGTLSRKKIDFAHKSTVCKYVVPEGYGTKSISGKSIFVNEESIKQTGSKLFYASVDEKNGDIYTTTSRSLAILGIADEIAEAERMCEESLKHVRGRHVYVRHDIGTHKVIQKRVTHMNMLRG
jgi:phosphoribosylamine--glycine ligase